MLIRISNIFILMILLSFSTIVAQNNNGSYGLIPSRYESLLYEIGEIRISGNTHFNYEQISNVINSRATSRSISHRLMQSFYNEIIRINSTPDQLLTILRKNLRGRADEIRFFNSITADADAESIENLYRKNGFHDAKVSYSFHADSSIMENILEFHVNEGKRAFISSMNFLGLMDLKPNLHNRIISAIKIKEGDPFSENSIMSDINRVRNILLDNGYFFATYTSPPLVFRDTANYKDSIVVTFKTGKPQKIGDISIIDSTRGQPKIQGKLIRQQLLIEPGDLYKRSRILQSEENLRFLNIFAFVSIDTSSEFEPMTDSTLNFKVHTQYRKMRDWGFGLFINRTAFDKITNLGLEGSFTHRNLLNKAQTFNPFVRVVLKDLSRTIEGQKPEFEVQAGIKYGQPVLWTPSHAKVGVYATPLFSIRSISLIQDNSFNLYTFSFPIKFPVQQPQWTYFNNISFDFTFERQWPSGFQEAINSSLDSASTDEDREKIIGPLLLYDNLDKYINGNNSKWYALTANLIGISLTADHRDNLFSPTRGDFASISADAWNPLFIFSDELGGIAKYVRLQFAYYWFKKISKRNVFAFKGKFGGIWQIDKENSYVPFERQFFAGGANSIRGWSSRKLRYSVLQPDSSDLYEFVQDFVGNAGIIESSAEFRFKFTPPSKWGNFWKEQISALGLTVFVDVGNAFDWFADDETKMEISDYFTKLAVAGGFGLRYDTPVGPFRIDFAWPVYNPNNPDNPTIFTQEGFMNKMQFHIALGHAF